MKEKFDTSVLREYLEFNSVLKVELIQELWSSYGELLRVYLSGFEQESIIVKFIHAPEAGHHPRGWNTDIGHQRKNRSYEVEMTWYRKYASLLENSKVPNCIAFQKTTEYSFMILEDLNPSGYPLRKTNLSNDEIKSCLKWLANFHAHFMDAKISDLWEIGSYWNLSTREEEYNQMDESKLKKHASEIDERLNSCKFQTLIHGDAKYANFCFSESGEVAAVDFQYVGKGCGMKDVAYLLSCIGDSMVLQEMESEFLDYYFQILSSNLNSNAAEIEEEWRELYPYAWTDFARFLEGWSSGHWKYNTFIKEKVFQALNSL